MQNHTHRDYSHPWYIRTRLQCSHIFMTRHAKSQNHTHTHITVIIDTSEQGYNAAISSWRDMKNHTHTSIFLAGHRSCSQVVDLAARGQWISSIYVDDLENWLLTCNDTTKIFEPALLVHKSIPRVEGESIGKIMIIWHRMKDCSSWKQRSLDTWWNCSSWCQEVLGYLPRTRLRVRGMSQGFF
jgi:hypothetical protein